MALDIKEMVENVIGKAKNDPAFMNKLKEDPEKAIESVIGIDIPDDIAKQVVTTVKAKLSMDTISGIINKFKN